MYRTRDWIRFTLDLPMLHEPGTHGSYCTGGLIVAGHLIALRSGMSLDSYAQSYLFDPLDIRASTWRRSPDGAATGGGGLRLRPRDAAKFGALFVNEGVWNGVRVIPESWVLESRRRVHALGPWGYGLSWWKHSFSHRGGSLDSVFTTGNGGNFILTFPDLELVLTFTGSNYQTPRTAQLMELAARLLTAAP